METTESFGTSKVRENNGTGSTSLTQVASEKATELGNAVSNRVQKFGSQVRDSANQGIAAVGKAINDAGSTVRERAPNEGVVGSAATAIADRLESSGTYLSERDLDGLSQDFSEMVRRYPLRALGIGLGVGVLLGRCLTRRE